MSDTEIRAKLVIEDGGTKVLEKVSDGFEDVEDASEKADEGVGSFFREGITLAHEFGINLGEQVEKIKEFGASFLEAAGSGNKADTAMAGMLLTSQDQGWDESIDTAERMGDELDAIARKAGVANDSVGNAFQTMLEISGATEQGFEKASNQVDEISTIAGVLGKDADGIAREFSLMGEGMLKTKGQLFQLLQSTGIFGTNIKKAGEYWGKLSDEQRAAALDQGLGKIADKLREAQPSFDQMLTTAKDIYDSAKEKLGEPLMKALMPALQAVEKRLEAGGPMIEKLVARLSTVSEMWVDTALDVVDDTLTWLGDNFDYIVDVVGETAETLREAFLYARDAVSFIAQHKPLFMALAAAMAANSLGGGAMGASKIAGGIGSLLSGGLAGLGTSASAALVPLLELAPALIAIGAAAYIATQFAEAEADRQDTVNKGRNQRDTMAKGGDVEGLDMALQTKRNMLATAEDRAKHPEREDASILGGGVDENKKQIEQYKKDISELEAQIEQAKGVIQKEWQTSVDHMEAVQTAADEVSAAYDEAARTHHEAAQAYAENLAASTVNDIVAGYNAAALAHDTATQQYYAGILENSTQLQDAFMQSGLKIEGGLKGLAEMLLDDSSKFAEALGKMGGSFAGKAPKANFSLSGGGPVTINVKQDFRDQDPDRVAVVFTEDIERAAARRLQASSVTPFGT